MLRSLPFVTALAMAIAGPAFAQPSKSLGRNGDWESFAYSEKAGKVCYAASMAKKKGAEPPGRGEAFLLVTHGPGKSANIVSLTPGFALKDGSEVEAEVGPTKIKLFTKGDTAWARSGDDKLLVNAMQKGQTLVIRATPAKGKPTQDSYSLSGFGAAYGEIGKACGVK
ncbi:MAG: invasion associated locus B family protein [Rhodospirillales bacterium]|nr:invasion associated locus B family protein [Rhodospirillales bacterium]